MADPIKPPIITPIDAAEDALEDDDRLPDHELRDTPAQTAPGDGDGNGNLDEGESEGDSMETPADEAKVVPTTHLPGG